MKMQRELQAANEGKPKRGQTSADVVEKELAVLEATLPLCALCVFRTLAVEGNDSRFWYQMYDVILQLPHGIN